MTGRVLVTDYAWPDLRVETAVLAELGSTAAYAGRAAVANAA